MRHFYTYGTPESDFEALKLVVTILFDVNLQEHESGWWGVYAKGATAQIQEIKLYPNFAKGEGNHVDVGDYEYLLDISCSEKTQGIPSLVKTNLSQFKLVKYNEL